MKTIAMLTATILFLPTLAKADDGGAYILLLQCQNAVAGSRGPEGAACTSYLTGVMEGDDLAVALGKSKRLFCTKGPVLTAQLAAMYVNRVQPRQQLWTASRQQAAYAVLVNEFPCAPPPK